MPSERTSRSAWPWIFLTTWDNTMLYPWRSMSSRLKCSRRRTTANYLATFVWKMKYVFRFSRFFHSIEVRRRVNMDVPAGLKGFLYPLCTWTLCTWTLCIYVLYLLRSQPVEFPNLWIPFADQTLAVMKILRKLPIFAEALEVSPFWRRVQEKGRLQILRDLIDHIVLLKIHCMW